MPIMLELNASEIDTVSSAGVIGSILGGLTVSATNAINIFLDTAGPIGNAIDTVVPALIPANQLGDQVLLNITSALNSFADAIGGPVVQSIPKYYPH